MAKLGQVGHPLDVRALWTERKRQKFNKGVFNKAARKVTNDLYDFTKYGKPNGILNHNKLHRLQMKYAGMDEH